MAATYGHDSEMTDSHDYVTDMKSESEDQHKDDSSESSGRSHLARVHTNTIIAEQERKTLRRIATQLSAVQSDAVGRVGTETDEALDPACARFDLSKWLGNFIQKIQAQGLPRVHPGVVFENLTVSGSAPDLQVQQTVGMWLRAPVQVPRKLLSGRRVPNKTILHGFDGLLEGGELLVVLGRPGSGCSTLLKTVSGELHGLTIDKGSTIHYGGVPQAKMIKEYRGEVVYNQEVDKHFPELTVGQTLEFAASVRMPSSLWGRISRRESASYVAKVVMAVCGLSHTYNTKVGNEFIRGVSGGERKRVSIAEMMVAGSPIMVWDNSTRGLDSATALRFVQTLRVAADLAGSAHAVAIYQASESIYELFDKAVVLMEGRQIFFGPASAARGYFERQGWLCPQRQTTGDFLTSVTNPLERRPRPGMETQVPRTAVEFEACWHASPEYAALQAQLAAYQQRYPLDPNGAMATQLHEAKTYKQAKHVRPASPYLISLPTQIALNTRRAYQRTRNDLTPALTTAIICLVLALIIGSVVYGTPADATAGFYAKLSVLFMAVLLNALITITEINSLYAQRPIVEKHASYAFYHPATEAIAGIVADIPVKFIVACIFNVIIYFLAGLRREPSQFFIYFLFSYTATFTMAAIFRTMAAVTRTISQAMSLAGIVILALVMYTGFVVNVPDMHPWFGWIRWLNPLYYAFEALVANEFHGRNFTCSVLTPAYTPPIGSSWVCSTVGAVAGQNYVNGDIYIAQSYSYYYTHVWRNFGIMVAFLIFFMTFYFAATEINSQPASTGEMLVFQEGHVPPQLLRSAREASAADHDAEKGCSSNGSGSGSGSSSSSKAMAAGSTDKNGAENMAGDLTDTTDVTAISVADPRVHGMQPQRDIFTWESVVYDIQVKGEHRRLLSDVSGWVKPGTLTALMGVSGAGKTTLLDVLAERTTMGVITGDMLVNGKTRGDNFQRSTGYVQQQDLHLETATVRESLQFSAMLRQPNSVSQKEKYAFVEDVIAMLGMEEFADAVVGIPGGGLNVEQRKLLTIGVELAARPKLLLFLDEPTSGLDSQSSWAICSFLRKLADAGQAILCTIHQPSAVLFEQFDRLLFLAQGGRTVYFGDIGADSRILLDYFAAKGARRCGDAENPAEYMLEIVDNTKSADGHDWHDAWLASAERVGVDEEIKRIHAERRGIASAADEESSGRKSKSGTAGVFAMPFGWQLLLVTRRIFQQYWRMPHYIAAKLLLGNVAGLFIGFTYFRAKHTLSGTQGVVFSAFQIVTIFTSLVQQIQPLFVTQRALYEVRERPGKMYSWVAFMMANIVVEFPYQILTAVMTYASYSYPIVGVQSPQRQGLMLLYMIQLFIYASSFAHMCIAALPDAQTAGGVVTLIVMMSIIFSGVLQTPTALPGFWIFMYRVSPFTYWISGVISAQVHGRSIECSAHETNVFDPPVGYTCGRFMSLYLQFAPGKLQNPDDTSACRYCQITYADQYLSMSGVFWSDRWRNFGILWGYVAFNIFVAIATYYVFRVRRWSMPDMSVWWKKKKKN